MDALSPDLAVVGDPTRTDEPDDVAGRACAKRVVVWTGSTPPPRLREILEPKGFRFECSTAALARDDDAVLYFGPRASPESIAASVSSQPHCPAIVHLTDEPSATFDDLIASDRLFYVARAELADRDLAALIECAFESVAQEPTAGRAASPDRFLSADVVRRIAVAQSVAELTGAFGDAIVRSSPAEQGRCVLVDRQRKILWEPGTFDEDEGHSPAVGLVSFVVRTGRPVCVPRAGDDARFDEDLDGEPANRFAAIPVCAGGTIAAVLIASRSPHQPPFEPLAMAALEALAAHVSPYVAAWFPAAEEADGESPFRRRALREIEMAVVAGPEPLRIERQWARRASWLGIATFVAVLLAAIFVRVPEYASGEAVVRGSEVVALLPARDATRLMPGMKIRFEWTGRRAQWLAIDTVRTRGAHAVVTARASRLEPGLRGRIEARVGSRRLLFALLPSLARVEGARNG